jgi:hypothetical protein
VKNEERCHASEIKEYLALGIRCHWPHIGIVSVRNAVDEVWTHTQSNTLIKALKARAMQHVRHP